MSENTGSDRWILIEIARPDSGSQFEITGRPVYMTETGPQLFDRPWEPARPRLDRLCAIAVGDLEEDHSPYDLEVTYTPGRVAVGHARELVDCLELIDGRLGRLARHHGHPRNVAASLIHVGLVLDIDRFLIANTDGAAAEPAQADGLRVAIDDRVHRLRRQWRQAHPPEPHTNPEIAF